MGEEDCFLLLYTLIVNGSWYIPWKSQVVPCESVLPHIVFFSRLFLVCMPYTANIWFQEHTLEFQKAKVEYNFNIFQHEFIYISEWWLKTIMDLNKTHPKHITISKKMCSLFVQPSPLTERTQCFLPCQDLCRKHLFNVYFVVSFEPYFYFLFINSCLQRLSRLYNL